MKKAIYIFIITFISLSCIDKKIDLTGSYNLESETFVGTLNVKQIDNKNATFDLVIVGPLPQSNIGEISGVIIQKDDGTWKFNSNKDYLDCSLDFKINDKGISIITEKYDCDFGINVYVDGVYKKELLEKN